MKCTSETSKVSIYSVSTYENVTAHEGDLIINGTQTFVIGNCTYIQRGNIFVSGYAKMKIYNSIFRMDQDYWYQFRFRADEQASLEIVNSSIDDSKGFGLQCSGYSKINMNNSDLKGMSTLADGSASVAVSNCTANDYLGPRGNCRMVVLNSNLVGIRLNCPPRASPEFKGVIDGLRVGHIEYLKLQQNQTALDFGFDLTLVNTTITAWWLDIVQETKLVLSDSTLELLCIWYSQTDAGIYGLRPGYFEDYEVCNLALRRTSITDIWVYVFDSASINLMDTKLSLHFFDGKCTASLSNSEVLSFLAARSSGVLFFNRSSLVCNGMTNTRLYIVGDVTHIEWWGDWFSSNVTRNYTIVMRDTNSNFLENIELTLFDKDNNALWNGFSDSLGTVSFNLTFADNNHTDTSMFRAFKEGFYNFTSSLSLLSSTPVSVSLTQKPLGDINEDRFVNILDISLVARSFGCVQGDERWNETCDLNKDAEINIVDITLVAKDYGKTV
jgi:hypothetical protein